MTTPEVSLHPSHEAGAHPSSPAPDTRRFPDISQESPLTSAYWDTLQQYQQTGAYEQEPLSPEEEAKRMQREKMFWKAVKRAEKIVFVAVPALALPIIMSACTTPGMVGIVGMSGDNARPDSSTGIAPLDPTPSISASQHPVDITLTLTTIQPDIIQGTVIPPVLPLHTQEYISQPLDGSPTFDPFIPLDTATIESSLTPKATAIITEQPPAVTEQPTMTATPEPSPTPEEDEEDAIWCNYEDKYWVYLHETLDEIIKKDPVPIIKYIPFSITHWGDDPETEKIEQSQCVAVLKDGPSGFETLKTVWGFSDKDVQECVKENYKIFLGKNFTDPKTWKIPKNKMWRFQFYKKSRTCGWDIFDLSPEYREDLEDLYPDLR